VKIDVKMDVIDSKKLFGKSHQGRLIIARHLSAGNGLKNNERVP
jgi:hypothetical protein